MNSLASFTKLRLILVSFLFLLFFFVSARADDIALSINAVKKVAKGCENCVFFAVSNPNALIQKHKLYFVSTLDRIPSPFWTVAISSKGQTYLLDTKNLLEWNKMARDEHLNLKTDKDLENLAKAFLELAVGRAIFIDKLLPAEIERIKKKTKSVPGSSLQVMREKNIYSLSFFAKDITGALQLWDLIAEPTGQILKADVSEF